MERPDVAAPRWVVQAPIPADLQARSGLQPILAQLLYNRGLLEGGHQLEAIQRFLNPSWQTGVHDPFLMAGMEQAVERVLAAVAAGETVGVFGHYDADGITATVLLTEALQHLGAAVIPYLPNRADEYGINEAGLGFLAEQGVRLVVSVDCGIRSFDASAAARRRNMDLIITDHHTVLRQDGRDVLPEATAVLNPLRADCRYPYKGLAGVGVAFKLAQALLQASARVRGESVGHYVKWLLDLVCLGTVADVVDITGENRTLVSLGLHLLQRARRPGIRALLGVAGTDIGRLDTRTVAYQLAPRINAAARLETAETSLSLLRAPDASRAEELAQVLERLNRERQRLTDAAIQDVTERYGDTLREHMAIVAAGQWPPGIIGLVAGKLSEAYCRPAAVLADEGGEELHGSARSPASFNITEALARCGDLLTRFGGHAQAAGFTLPARNLDAFRDRLTALADAEMPPEAAEPALSLDAILEPNQVTPELLRHVLSLEPCGPGNPPPLFGMLAARILDTGTAGGAGQHLRLRLDGGDRPLSAMAFGMGRLSATFGPGSLCDLAFSLEAGRTGMELRVVDIRAAQAGSTAEPGAPAADAWQTPV